jgi:hypothetical protein
MTHRWIKTSCVVVVFNAVLVLTSILHRQLTASVDLPSASTTLSMEASSSTDTRTIDSLASDGSRNPEVAEFQKLRDAGLAPNLANLEAKPVPEDDKLMAELRKKAAEAFPIMEGLNEPQSISSRSTQSASISIESTLADTPLARKSSSLGKLSEAHIDLAKLAQHFDRAGDSAKVKVISEQIQALEKIMQELLTTPAF